jgi:integrase
VARYAAFLEAHGFSPDERWRKVSRAVTLCRRMGDDLAGPGQLTWPWLERALAGPAGGGRSHPLAPSFVRFLRDEGLLPERTAEERQRTAIAGTVSRVPWRFRRLVQRYTDFRLRVQREQRRQRLAHVLALKTIAADVGGLGRFAAYLERDWPAVTGWDLVTEREVVAYLRTLDVHPNTRNVQRWDLHSFFAYSLRHRLVAHNPVPDAPGREAPSAFQPLPPEAQHALLTRWARLADPLESLVGCLVLLHGLSASDVQRLRLADVDHTARRLRVASRPVPLALDALTWRALEAYLAVRPSAPAYRHNPHLVLNASSRFTADPVTQRYLRLRLRPSGRSPQALRMTCLSTVAQESGPRLLVDAFGLSPTQAGRYQRFLAYRADQALAEHVSTP